MKVKGAKKVHYDSGPNMTPLVDVVMVILIFLMLAGSFGGVEHYLISSVPTVLKGGSNETTPPGFVPPTRIDVRVDLDPASVAEASQLDPNNPDAKLHLRYRATAGRAVATGDYSQLLSELTQLREGFNNSGKPTDELQVIIMPGSGVLYRHLIDVYQAAATAGFTKIGFSVAH